MQSLRRRADRFIHHPWVELSIAAMILVSVLALPVELLLLDTHPHLMPVAWVGEGLTAVFIVELSIRFWVARKKSRFFRRYWVDILSVLPLGRPLRVFRVLRLLRLFRAGALLDRQISAFSGGVPGGRSEVISLAIGSLVLVLSGAVVIFKLEGVENPDVATLSDALWYALLSLVAGEPIGADPTTFAGKATTLVLMLGGMSIFGVFVGAVSAGMVARFAGGFGGQEMDVDELEGHALVLGWNASGPTVLASLVGPHSPRDRAVVIITEGLHLPEDIPARVDQSRVYFHHGDWTRPDVLALVNVKSASLAVLLTDTTVARSDQDRDARNVLAAMTLERLVPGLYTVVELTSPQGADLLRMAGVEEIVIGDRLAGSVIGSAARARGLVQVVEGILSDEQGQILHALPLPVAWVGLTVAEVHQRLLVSARAVLVSLERGGVSEVNPDPAKLTMSGDRLVVLAHHDLEARKVANAPR